VAEIKSTLDLVLEKTRDLTLTEEEKRNFERAELDKKVQGIVNRYLDGSSPVSRLREELEGIDGKEADLRYELLARHLVAHFNLDTDNTAIVSALREVVGFDTAPLVALQREYQAEREDTEKSLTEEAYLALRKKGVSGSAVKPNLNRIPEWGQSLNDLSQRYQERLKAMGNTSQVSP
jgi:methionyl-tRNA synthetase